MKISTFSLARDALTNAFVGADKNGNIVSVVGATSSPYIMFFHLAVEPYFEYLGYDMHGRQRKAECHPEGMAHNL